MLYSYVCFLWFNFLKFWTAFLASDGVILEFLTKLLKAVLEVTDTLIFRYVWEDARFPRIKSLKWAVVQDKQLICPKDNFHKASIEICFRV